MTLLFIFLSVLGHWWIFVPAAFLSILSFFHINSYVGDKYKINWLFWVLGFVFLAITAWQLVELIGTNH